MLIQLTKDKNGTRWGKSVNATGRVLIVSDTAGPLLGTLPDRYTHGTAEDALADAEALVAGLLSEGWAVA